MNSFERSWIFTKSAWRVLKLDKELLAYPIYTFIWSIIVLAIFAGIAFATGTVTVVTDSSSASADSGGLRGLAIALPYLLASMFVTNYFAGALIASAIKRFKGEDPTVAYGLEEARKRIGSIAMYTLFSGLVIYLLRAIQERVPFAGKVIAYFAEIAWNIANIFSLPVIMTSEEPVSPIDAMKQSLAIIKKTWAEAAVTNFGMGLIGFLVMFAYLAVAFSLVGVLAVSGFIPGIIFTGIIALVGLFIIVAGISAMSGIINAAIYYYAITGTNPEQFDQQLLETAFTAKKAKKLFS